MAWDYASGFTFFKGSYSLFSSVLLQSMQHNMCICYSILIYSAIHHCADFNRRTSLEIFSMSSQVVVQLAAACHKLSYAIIYNIPSTISYIHYFTSWQPSCVCRHNKCGSTCWYVETYQRHRDKFVII